MVSNRGSLIGRIVKNPIVIILAMAAGVYTGIMHKDFAMHIAPMGDFFLLLLWMCVIPILLSSVISSFGQLAKTRDKSINAGSILLFFLGAFVLTAVIAFGFTSFLKPGILSIDQQKVLGTLLQRADETVIENINENHSSIVDSLFSLIPENIFAALSSGNSMQILFFSILIGISSGLLNDSLGNRVLELFDSLFNIFLDIINWTMFLLPIGLYALLAGQIAETGPDILMAMIKYIICIYLISLSIIILNGVILSINTKKSFITFPFYYAK